MFPSIGVESFPLYLLVAAFILDKVITYISAWRANQRRQDAFKVIQTTAGTLSMAYLFGTYRHLDDKVRKLAMRTFDVNISPEKWEQINTVIEDAVDKTLDKRRQAISDKVGQNPKRRPVQECVIPEATRNRVAESPPVVEYQQDTDPPAASRLTRSTYGVAGETKQ